MEVERLTVESENEGDITLSKKKRIRETRKYEARVKAAISEDRIEDDLKGVKMERVISKASTKQVMIARVCLCYTPVLSSAHDAPLSRPPLY